MGNRQIKFGSKRDVTLTVLGLDNSGKTTLVDNLVDNPEDENQGPSFGYTPRRIRRGRYNITLVDLGGRHDYRDIWPKYYAETHAIIYVMDVSDEERFGENKNVLREIMMHPKMQCKPLLILCNKIDKRTESIDLFTVCQTMEIQQLLRDVVTNGPIYHQPLTRMFLCSALRRVTRNKTDKRINNALNWLLRTVGCEWEALERRVAHDNAVELERRERERQERIARRRRRQEEETRLATETSKAEAGIGTGAKPTDIGTEAKDTGVGIEREGDHPFEELIAQLEESDTEAIRQGNEEVQRMCVATIEDNREDEHPLSADVTKLNILSNLHQLLVATDMNEDMVLHGEIPQGVASCSEATSNVATNSTIIRDNTGAKRHGSTVPQVKGRVDSPKGHGSDKGSRKDSGISVQDSSGVSVQDSRMITDNSRMKEISSVVIGTTASSVEEKDMILQPISRPGLLKRLQNRNKILPYGIPSSNTFTDKPPLESPWASREDVGKEEGSTSLVDVGGGGSASLLDEDKMGGTPPQDKVSGRSNAREKVLRLPPIEGSVDALGSFHIPEDLLTSPR